VKRENDKQTLRPSIIDDTLIIKKIPVTLYHNHRCSKSRQTLMILNSRQDCNTEVIEYLKSPPSVQQLKKILTLLAMQPRELMRTNEAPYRNENLNATDLSDAQLIAKMIEHPILIERPIVIAGEKAVIGRPPEKVLDIL